MNSDVTKYDPRLRQDYTVRNFMTVEEFSSLEHNLFVLDCIGTLDWAGELQLLIGCIQNTASKCFVMFDPWGPGKDELRNAIELEFGPVMEFEHTYCCYTNISIVTLDRLFQLRAKFDGYASGQWCIGGCIAEFTPPERTGFGKRQLWDIALVLGQPEKIGCVLSLGEMQQSFFATRLFKGLDILLSKATTTHFQ
jgi:hypothetical protein